MRIFLLLALAAWLRAEVTETRGYHIVQTRPGETHATPTASPTTTTTGKKIRRPAARRKAATAAAPNVKAPAMATQITGTVKR